MATIDLPVQRLDWSSITQHQLKKIFFQFEISQSKDNLKILLVAYPAYMPGWRTIRVELPVISSETPIKLNLPLTFGNIEIGRPGINAINRTGKNEFILKSKISTQNPHAGYEIFDGTTSLVNVNPSPPEQPEPL